MTLIEVLVALGILAAVAVVFLVGMATSSKAVMVSQEAVIADSLAKSQMEDTKARDYAPTYPKITIPQDLVDQGYDVAIVAAPLHNLNDDIQKITVTVTYNEETAFTLVGYKVWFKP
jgi:type II secretory pathway pseudopilin PulG